MNMLNDTGLSHIWNNQGVANECWQSRLNVPSRASLFKYFSQTICYQKDLDYVDAEKFRYSLTTLTIC